jgi:hypothetical protein
MVRFCRHWRRFCPFYLQMQTLLGDLKLIESIMNNHAWINFFGFNDSFISYIGRINDIQLAHCLLTILDESIQALKFIANRLKKA